MLIRSTTTLAILSALAASAAAQTSKEVSAQAVTCHDEATKRYIAGFAQIGLRHKSLDGSPFLVTVFQNDTAKYQEYLAECMKRWKSATMR